MDLIRRLIDRWKHPGETQVMRDYRRWRNSTGRGAPYRLTAVSLPREGGPWMARPMPRVAQAEPDPRWSDDCQECGAEIGVPCKPDCIRELPEPIRGPIVGATLSAADRYQ